MSYVSRWFVVLISRSQYKEALRIAQTAILAVVLALRKLTLSLILTVCIVVIWHENIVLYYTDVYIYKNIKWEKYVYLYTSYKLGDIYADAYIHLCACVRVCRHNMYMCIPTRCPRSPVSEGEFLFRFSCCAFRETLHRWQRNLPKFWSQMTRSVVAVDDENRPETKGRDIEARSI